MQYPNADAGTYRTDRAPANRGAVSCRTMRPGLFEQPADATGGATMRGYITDPAAEGGLALRDDLPEPKAKPDECIIEVRAFAMNRGEMNLLQQRAKDWTPGQDVAGIIAQQAA